MQRKPAAPAKTATIPPLRVAPDLRRSAEDVLEPGETLSAFVEQSIRQHVALRQAQREFIARGQAAAARARRRGRYVSASSVMAGLERRLEVAKAKSARKAKAGA